MAECICQRAYNTGFTGIAKIDERLSYHYDWWLEKDSIKRDYDHYAFGVPYVEHSARRPYCFTERRPMRCNHRACEHARHRAPDTVKKMRFYIEGECEAHVHYPELLERIDRSGDTRPEMDNAEHLAAQWDEFQYRLHRFQLDTEREKPRKLRVISLAEFADDCYPVPEAKAVGEFLQAFSHSRNDIPRHVLYDDADVTVTFDPAILAEHAAAEAADALYGPRVEADPQDKTLERWHVWNRQRQGLTADKHSVVAEAVGAFIAA